MNTGGAGGGQHNGRVNVEFLNNAWIVKNHGDSTILFTSHDKQSAEKFARDMSEAHEIDVKVYPREKNSSSPVKKPEELKIDVQKRDGRWVVRRAGEEKNLFESGSREDAVVYARSLDEGNGLDLHIDKD